MEQAPWERARKQGGAQAPAEKIPPINLPVVVGAAGAVADVAVDAEVAWDAAEDGAVAEWAVVSVVASRETVKGEQMVRYR